MGVRGFERRLNAIGCVGAVPGDSIVLVLYCVIFGRSGLPVSLVARSLPVKRIVLPGGRADHMANTTSNKAEDSLLKKGDPRVGTDRAHH